MWLYIRLKVAFVMFPKIFLDGILFHLPTSFGGPLFFKPFLLFIFNIYFFSFFQIWKYLWTNKRKENYLWLRNLFLLKGKNHFFILHQSIILFLAMQILIYLIRIQTIEFISLILFSSIIIQIFFWIFDWNSFIYFLKEYFLILFLLSSNSVLIKFKMKKEFLSQWLTKIWSRK